jgi:hypothetical protein
MNIRRPDRRHRLAIQVVSADDLRICESATQVLGEPISQKIRELAPAQIRCADRSHRNTATYRTIICARQTAAKEVSSPNTGYRVKEQCRLVSPEVAVVSTIGHVAA